MEMADLRAPVFQNKIKEIYEKDLSLKPDQDPAPFFSLFRFADRTDYILMVLGAICAIGNGIAIPFFAYPYGELTEAFSQNASRDAIVEQVKKAYVAFLINSVVVFLFSWIMFSSWMITSERQSIKCRKIYFEALMRQEVAWYDHTRVQELASNVYSESSHLQNAIGEKVSKVFMTTSMGLAGFIIAFVRGWKLAIVVTSVIPFLLVAGFFNNKYLKKASDFMQKVTSRARKPIF
jgi:ATP-binding cassette subfamily B (MDR/TAP) protein 1